MIGPSTGPRDPSGVQVVSRYPGPDRLSVAVRLVPALLLCGFMSCATTSPAHDAAGTGDLDRLAQLFSAGEDLSARLPYVGLTPLHVAVNHRQPEAVRFLITRGAVIDVLDGNGHTPLHAAVANRDRHMIALLLDLGASTPDREGNSPVYLAAFQGSDALAQFLLDLGASRADHDQGIADNRAYLRD